MGLKADLKKARAMMVASDHAACLTEVNNLLTTYSGTQELLGDAQAHCALQMMRGMCSVQCCKWKTGVEAFEIATQLQPDAPQAWKGLAQCLEECDGDDAKGRLAQAWTRMAEIAEGKNNWSRALALRLKAAAALVQQQAEDYYKNALTILRMFLDNEEAMRGAVEGAAGEEDRLALLELRLRVVILEYTREVNEATVKTVTDKKKKGGGSGGGGWKEVLFSEEGAMVERQISDVLPLLDVSVTAEENEQVQLQLQSVTALADEFAAAVCGRLLEKMKVVDAPKDKLAVWQELQIVCAAMQEKVLFAGRASAPAAGLLLSAVYVDSDEGGSGDDNDEATSRYTEMASLCAEAPEEGNSALRIEGLLYQCRCALLAGQISSATALLDTAYGMLEASAPPATGASASSSSTATLVIGERTGNAKDDASTGANVMITPVLPWKDKELPCSWRLSCLRCYTLIRNGFRGGGMNALAAADVCELAEEEAKSAVSLYGRPRGGSVPAVEQGGDGCAWDCQEVIAVARAGLLSDQLHSYEGAERVLNGALEALLSPTSPVAMAMAPYWKMRLGSLVKCGLSRVALAKGAKRRAMELLRDVVEVDGDDGCVVVLRDMGMCMMAKEDYASALPLLEKASTLSSKMVDDPLTASSCALQLAICHWNLGGELRTDRKKCFAQLLRAAKLDPSSADAFGWLGRWYREVGGDATRAKGCWQRALKVDPADEGAGLQLTKMYLSEGQLSLARSVLRQAVEGTAALSKSHWAWLRLGRMAMVEGNLKEASDRLQQAIRGRPKAWQAWADLGWIYHSQCKHFAALKAYGRAEELLEVEEEEEGDPVDQGSTDRGKPPAGEGKADRIRRNGLLRVTVELGRVQREVGQCDESAENFSKALAVAPDSTLAVQGACETLLTQAHSRATEGLFSAAADCLRKGVDLAGRLTDLTGLSDDGGRSVGTVDGANGHGNGPAGAGGAKGRYCCTWKTQGDLYTYAYRLPPSCFAGGVKEQLAFMAQGEAAYAQALTLTSEEQKASAYYDLGLNAYLQCRVLRLSLGEGSGTWECDVYDRLPEVEDLTAKAARAFKEGIRLRPLDSDAWNGLGVVSRDPLVQQHSFVRAIQINHNPSAWANLSMLYLTWGKEDQAYESLGGLQSICDHPAMWIGLGMLKQRSAALALGLPVTETRVESRKRAARGEGGEEGWADDGPRRGGGGSLPQASDAYYSALETMHHPDGLFGLGSVNAMAMSVAVTSANTSAVTSGSGSQSVNLGDGLVALQQYVELNPANAAAWNLLGCLIERSGGQPHRAAGCFQTVITLLKQQQTQLGHSDDSSDRLGTDRCVSALRIAYANLGRALLCCCAENSRDGKDRRRAPLDGGDGVGGSAATAALAAVDALRQSDLGKPMNVLNLGRALAAMGQWDEALAALTTLAASSSSSSSSSSPSSAEASALLCASLLSHLRGDTAASAAAVRAVMQRFPANQTVLMCGLVVAALAGDAPLVRHAMPVLERQMTHRGSAVPGKSNSIPSAITDCQLAFSKVLKACGAPSRLVKRRLLKAVHMAPGDCVTWMDMSVVLLQDCVALAGAGGELVGVDAGSVGVSSGSEGDGDDDSGGGGGGGSGGRRTRELAEVARLARKAAVSSLVQVKSSLLSLGIRAAKAVKPSPSARKRGRCENAYGLGGAAAMMVDDAYEIAGDGGVYGGSLTLVAATDTILGASDELADGEAGKEGDSGRRRKEKEGSGGGGGGGGGAAAAGGGGRGTNTSSARKGESGSSMGGMRSIHRVTGLRVLLAALHANPGDARAWRLLALSQTKEAITGTVKTSGPRHKEDKAGNDAAATGSRGAAGVAAGIYAALLRQNGGETTESGLGQDTTEDVVIRLLQSHAMLLQEASPSLGGSDGSGDGTVVGNVSTEVVEAAARLCTPTRRTTANTTAASVAEAGAVKLGQARCYAARGDTDAALRAYEEAAELWPTLANVWCELARIHRSLGQAEAAVDALDRGIQALGGDASDHPGIVLLQLESCSTLLKLGRLEEAQSAVGRASRSCDVALLEVLRAMICARRGDTKRAAKAFRKARELDPHLPLLPASVVALEASLLTSG